MVQVKRMERYWYQLNYCKNQGYTIDLRNYLKYLNLLLTNPIVQLPLLIALVAPVILFSIPHSPKICPLLPIDDNASVDPLLEGMIATARHIRRNINNVVPHSVSFLLHLFKTILRRV